MTVFLAIDHTWVCANNFTSDEVIGVFSTREKAIEHIMNWKPEECEMIVNEDPNNLTIGNIREVALSVNGKAELHCFCVEEMEMDA